MNNDILSCYKDYQDHLDQVLKLISHSQAKLEDKINNGSFLSRLSGESEKELIREYIKVTNELIFLVTRLSYDYKKDLEIQSRTSLEIINNLLDRIVTEKPDND